MVSLTLSSFFLDHPVVQQITATERELKQ